MANRHIIHRNNIKNLVIITGQQKSGKSILTKLITTFSEPIKVNIDFALDNLIQLLKNNFINKSQFKNIFLLMIDNIFLNNCIGRNLNLKKNEESSIWSTSKPRFYLKKINSIINKVKLRKIIKKENEFYLTLHNFLEFKELSVNPIKKIKIIYIIPNPIDQIYKLYKSKKFITAGEASDRSIFYNYKDKMIFNDVYGYEKKYLQSTRIGKILLIKDIYDKADLQSLKKKNKNIKIMVLNYDEVVKNLNFYSNKISKFLNKDSSARTKKLIKSTEIKLRIKDCSHSRLEKKRNYLLSKIKKKYEQDLFKKILTNSKKINDYTKNFSK